MKRTYLAGLGIVLAAATAAFVAAPGAEATPTTSTVTAKTSSVGTAPFLKLAAAKKAADLAIADCLRRGYPVSVTVVDRDGVVVVQERADTATGATVEVSRQKAYASAGFQIPTSDIQNFAKTQPGFIAIDGFSALPGGLTIKGGGTVVGGIGVSGAPTGEIDADCGTVGVKAIS